jgi:phosphotransferase system enzyme I (PtsI)
MLILNPTAETLARYRSREEQAERREDVFQLERHAPAVTLCGSMICVGANAEFVEEAEIVQDSGAEEVGLFRTEFLHMENPDATEDELADAYSRWCARWRRSAWCFARWTSAGTRWTSVWPWSRSRTLSSAGAASGSRWAGGICSSVSSARCCARRVHGRVGIMFPMVSGVQEVREAKGILSECADELTAEGVDVPDEIEVGAMIEIPSAALSADLIAAEVDFLSLGTNDLIQYTIAVDRLNDRVAGLYQPTHPAVLRLIKMSVQAARGAGIRIGMCGEMASNLTLTPLMIGLGLNELSVASTQVARVKHAVRRLSVPVCEELADLAGKQNSPAEILSLSRALAERCYPNCSSSRVVSRGIKRPVCCATCGRF